MAKYHIKKDGTTGLCHATKGNCPLGGAENHFDTQEAAYEVAQERMENEFGMTQEVDRIPLMSIETKKDYYVAETANDYGRFGSDSFDNMHDMEEELTNIAREKGLLRKDERIKSALNEPTSEEVDTILDELKNSPNFNYIPKDKAFADLAEEGQRNADAGELPSSIYIEADDGSKANLSGLQAATLNGELNYDSIIEDIDEDDFKEAQANERDTLTEYNKIAKSTAIKEYGVDNLIDEYNEVGDGGAYDVFYEEGATEKYTDNMRYKGIIGKTDKLKTYVNEYGDNWVKANDEISDAPQFNYQPKDHAFDRAARVGNSTNSYTEVYIEHEDGSKSSLSPMQVIGMMAESDPNFVDYWAQEYTDKNR